MAERIDVVRLGERLRRVRMKRGLTLREVCDETKISIPTLSRIERGGASELGSRTLLALSEWLGSPVETLADKPLPKTLRTEQPVNTPEVVELYLRADKRLNENTAKALANMFRTAYETVAKEEGEK